MDQYLTSREVAAWIRISEPTLSRWRQQGIGPHAVWLAPTTPRYRRSDVELWLAMQDA